ncbi:MAG: redox-sensing transcriptional repressor Rex [Clostridia bacterium]|nr:redox-sensing transcriptional repressor Rex [Clostridia bacterium]
MTNAQGISELVINRLPRYHRFLGELLSEGVQRISSRELSERMGLTASQIRQDLNCFGGFGQQGYGYHIEQLRAEIGKILGLDKQNRAILIGAGNLGRAVASHMAFESKGFRLIGIFDKKEALKGQMIKGLPIRHIDDLDDFCRENLPSCAILCIPKADAADICNTLIGLGVKGFWNFSHCDLAVNHPNVAVENVHLGDSLMKLSYKITNL